MSNEEFSHANKYALNWELQAQSALMDAKTNLTEVARIRGYKEAIKCLERAIKCEENQALGKRLITVPA